MFNTLQSLFPKCWEEIDRMMKRSSHHWGELDPSLGVGASVSLVAPSSTVNRGTLEVSVEGPKLRQPSSPHKMQLLPRELCRPDILSLHTIQLLAFNHGNAVSPHHHGDGHKNYSKVTNVGTAPVPTLEDLAQQYPQSEHGKLDENGRLPEYHLRKGTIEIDRFAARKLSHRAVATVCAHAGYQTSEELALETLTDVLNEYLTKVCQLLRVAVDREAVTGSTGFQDTLTQVLQEAGVGPPGALYTFWRKRIKSYHEVVQKRTGELKSKMERRKSAISITGKSFSSEDEMPMQIFAETSKYSDTSNGGLARPEIGNEEGSWLLSEGESQDGIKLEPCEEESVESSSYTDSSSQIADMGSTSPWESCHETPPLKKKKKMKDLT